MLKRLIENWLIKASERTYELPFCHLLTAEQHQVIHLSRHGFLEQGKDILSIAPDGTPCAYQLKAGNITYSVYNSESDQLRRLVELPIKHSSIPSDIKPRVYLVTNGNLDEEVKTELQDRNLAWEQRGYPRAC